MHTAEGEADHTIRGLVPFVVGEAHVADDIALKEMQHVGLRLVDVHHTPAISNDVLHDLLDKMPEEGKL